jgi:hypothetical protein
MKHLLLRQGARTKRPEAANVLTVFLLQPTITEMTMEQKIV